MENRVPEVLQNDPSRLAISPDCPAIMKYEIADWFVKNFSVKGDTIVDPFLGTGTTAIASELNERKYVGYEISKEYCQIAMKRIAVETSTLF